LRIPQGSQRSAIGVEDPLPTRGTDQRRWMTSGGELAPDSRASYRTAAVPDVASTKLTRPGPRHQRHSQMWTCSRRRWSRRWRYGSNRRCRGRTWRGGRRLVTASLTRIWNCNIERKTELFNMHCRRAAVYSVPVTTVRPIDGDVASSVPVIIRGYRRIG